MVSYDSSIFDDEVLDFRSIAIIFEASKETNIICTFYIYIGDCVTLTIENSIERVTITSNWYPLLTFEVNVCGQFNSCSFIAVTCVDRISKFLELFKTANSNFRFCIWINGPVCVECKSVSMFSRKGCSLTFCFED